MRSSGVLTSGVVRTGVLAAGAEAASVGGLREQEAGRRVGRDEQVYADHLLTEQRLRAVRRGEPRAVHARGDTSSLSAATPSDLTRSDHTGRFAKGLLGACRVATVPEVVRVAETVVSLEPLRVDRK